VRVAILILLLPYALLAQKTAAVDGSRAWGSGKQIPALGSVESSAIPKYPDSPSGLEHLAKDILKAQKESDRALADALLRSLVVPNYEHWYRDNFTEEVVNVSLPQYRASANLFPAQLASFFLELQGDALQRVQAIRFERDCDDNADERMFAMLDGRLKEFPLYELRFFKGDRFRRLYAFAYVDDAFRFVLTPDFERSSGRKTNARPELAKRISVGGNVQAAKLIKRVQPVYPVLAREEHVSGTVRLHAIIGTDGSIQSLHVARGPSSLAKASVEAVKQWRYQPTKINGEPVEVDTEIDVIFQLSW
jgi:TonB family protein